MAEIKLFMELLMYSYVEFFITEQMLTYVVRMQKSHESK